MGHGIDGPSINDYGVSLSKLNEKQEDYNRLKTVLERTKVELMDAKESQAHLLMDVKAVARLCERILNDYR
tara:strand:- start:2255 stop:2467 length:213 start_codon:yes stop_codon:yes gene_type:complete